MNNFVHFKNNYLPTFFVHIVVNNNKNDNIIARIVTKFLIKY